MQFNEFIKLNEQIWHEYFSRIFTGFLKKQLTLQDGGKILFPNIILFTQTDDHYIVELLGANRGYSGLTTKKHKEKSTQKYLYQFDYQEESGYEGSMFRFESSDNKVIRGMSGMDGFLLSKSIDKNKLNQRFGFRDHWPTQLVRANEENGPLITFSENFPGCYFNNCVLVNRLNDLYRVKDIVHMTIINKKYSKEFYKEDLNKNLNEAFFQGSLIGVKYCKEEKIEHFVLSSQFVNTFLIPNIRETTIGEFLSKNPSFIQKALSCKQFLYEKELEWVEGNPNLEEKFINPDILIEREDGYFNICDLKLPKLDRKNLTKGKHKRRRFVDDVQEGIAQLANYEEYFHFDKNKEFAKSKYNVEVQSPELILIVGNYENLRAEEVREAARSVKSNYRIIDYDTLNALFLNKI
ncbi:Shedu anti-phage system protein SduA domain-containing protein [Peribacillus frigoritolerans]|uniref:Shedu protein SduA C-terminal domain-containing protein n=1 Tax=Peribacillus simplex TaxID=1478 RepID=A0A9W4L242_9BACI|nr:Shedu anti-phage system protein SduA domain-containing protein [Peribacillus simplex]CAH0289527.1 hypothetical protein SRABI133_04190 [Peribacillus simplex]